MIRQFSCKNFRNINVKELPLGRINILIGPNNSGKSNFIKALSFYSNMLKHASDGVEGTDFLNAMSRNGWKHSRNFLSKEGEEVSFEWHMDLAEEPMVFRFAYLVGDERKDFRITLEELNAEANGSKYSQEFNYFRAHKTKNGNGNISTALKKGKENKRIPIKVSSIETIISQFDKLLLEEKALYNSKTVRSDINEFVKELNNSFKSFYCYSLADLDMRAIRRRVDTKNVDSVLKRDGSNLTNVFNFYKNDNPLWKQKYLELLKSVMRNLVNIEVVDQRDTMAMCLVEKDKAVELADVSDGSIKALMLALLFCPISKVKYNLLAIDEPEINMHPAWQKVFADIVLESSSYEQCVISTHSPEFLDRFTDRFKEENEVEVFAFDLHGNIRHIKYEEIAQDLGDWLLGDLYRTQDPALGGWPW